jgi:hypothetical protein
MSLHDRIERYLAKQDATEVEMCVALGASVSRIGAVLEQLQRTGKAHLTGEARTTKSHNGEPDVIWASTASRKVEVGLTASIRAALCHGPATIGQLVTMTGADYRKVSNLLQLLRNRTDGVVQVEGTKPQQWALHGDRSVKERRARTEHSHDGPYAMALPITDGRRGYRWGAGW